MKLTKANLELIQKDGFDYCVMKYKWNRGEVMEQILRLALLGIEK